MSEVEANYRTVTDSIERRLHYRGRSRVGVVQRVHVVGQAGGVADLGGLRPDRRRAVLGLRRPEPGTDRPGEGTQRRGAVVDLREHLGRGHRRDVEVVLGVVAELMTAVED